MRNTYLTLQYKRSRLLETDDWNCQIYATFIMTRCESQTSMLKPVHTVAEKCDCGRIRRQSPLSRRFLLQSHFSATVWTGLYTIQVYRSIYLCCWCCLNCGSWSYVIFAYFIIEFYIWYDMIWYKRHLPSFNGYYNKICIVCTAWFAWNISR